MKVSCGSCGLAGETFLPPYESSPYCLIARSIHGRVMRLLLDGLRKRA